MKKVTKIVILCLLSASFILFQACEREGPAENAGEKIDETVEKAQDKMAEVGDKMQEATEKMGEQLEQAGEKMQNQ